MNAICPRSLTAIGFFLLSLAATAQVQQPSSDAPAPPASTKPLPGGANPEKSTATNLSDESVSAAEQNSENESNTPTPNFVSEVAIANLSEIRASAVAEKKSSNQQVRSLAAMMVRDHQKMTRDIQGLASVEKVSNFPADLDQQRKTTLSRLKSAKPKDFDKAYLEQMVHDHQALIGFMQRKSAKVGTGDDALQTFIKASLPTLTEHLNQSQQLLDAIKTGS